MAKLDSSHYQKHMLHISLQRLKCQPFQLETEVYRHNTCMATENHIEEIKTIKKNLLNPCVWANLTEQLFNKHLIIQVLIFKPCYNQKEKEGTPHKLV